MSNVKYLSYDGLTHYTEKLFELIEEDEEVIASSLVDLDSRLKTHTHSYVASAGYVATAANAVTSGRAIYSASAGYAATAARATYAASAARAVTSGYSITAGRAIYSASAGYVATADVANKVANTLTINANGGLLTSYNGASPKTINITAASIGAATSEHTHTEYAPSTHSHTYVASAGYSASAARATYAASAARAVTSGYSITAGRAIYSASAAYVQRVNINLGSSSMWYPMVFTSAKTATSGALLYIDSVTDTTSTATGIRYNPNTNACYCSGGFYEASDERLKNFGNDIEVDLDKLLKLSKKYFTWKNDESNTQHIGVSAQELQELYPEIVNIIDEDGHLSVSYDKLSVVALKSIDVLNDKIKSLEERLNKLEEKLNIV